MSVAWLMERLSAGGDAPALADENCAWSYRQLVERAHVMLATLPVERGEVVLLSADFSRDGVAALLALAARGAIIVPRIPTGVVEDNRLVELAGATTRLTIRRDGPAHVGVRHGYSRHPLYEHLRAHQAPGLVIFTSGSSGTPKAVVHDLGRLINNFRDCRPASRTLGFLLFDHIGGLNTLLQVLAGHGTFISTASHDPETVAALVARHRVELLPVSPSFLNLLVLSGAHARHDMSSLRMVSYGTESMPPATLARTAEALPGVRFHQLYGLSEGGILRSRPRGDDPAWMALRGPGVETRVVDGILQLRTPTTMLGYLNAPSPFTADGWLVTGDEVDVDGEWVRIKGRRSDMVNVGGQKVFPAEVEAVVSALENIADVTCYALPHALMGHVVACRVNLVRPEDPRSLRARIRAGCREHLAPYKTPVKIDVCATPLQSVRHKKVRHAEP